MIALPQAVLAGNRAQPSDLEVHCSQQRKRRGDDMACLVDGQTLRDPARPGRRDAGSPSSRYGWSPRLSCFCEAAFGRFAVGSLPDPTSHSFVRTIFSEIAVLDHARPT